MPCETVDRATQTEDTAEGEIVDWDESLENTYHGRATVEPTLGGEGPGSVANSGSAVGTSAAASSSRSFLDGPVQLMAEMEMAMRSTLESFHETRAVTFPEPRAPPSGTPSHASGRTARFLNLGRQMSAPAASPERAALAEDASDGEDGHGEDAEVKSLSLSEDGPVIRRSVSEPYYNFFPRTTGETSARGATLAPDPLAMLSDGERTLGVRTIDGRCEPQLAFCGELPRDLHDFADREHGLGELGADIDGEPLGSDRSAPNDSDDSAAVTIAAAASGTGSGAAGAPADEFLKIQHSGLVNGLMPILEKVAGSAPLGAAPSGKRPWRPTQQPRDGYKHVPAKRSEGGSLPAHVADLSQLSRLPLPPGSEPVPHSSRSDNASQLSFGSANSAFSPPSSLLSPSSSSSQLASPRPAHGLAASKSVPSISVAHKR